MEENRTKILVPAETKIGTIKAVKNDVIGIYNVLYGGFATSDKNEDSLFLVKENIHEEVLRKFLESDEGKEYVIPAKSEITDVFTNCQKREFILEYKRKKEEAKKALEQERLEKERLAKEEAERLEKEKQEKLRLEREKQLRAEQERLAKIEQERLEKERLENERLEKERQEAERLEQERQAKLEAERLEKERIEKERLEKERLEKEAKQKEELEKELQKQEAIKQENEAKESELAELLEEKRIKKENILDETGAQVVDYSVLSQEIDEANTKKIVKQVSDEVRRIIHDELKIVAYNKAKERKSSVYDVETGEIKAELDGNIEKLEKYAKIVKILTIVISLITVVGSVVAYIFTQGFGSMGVLVMLYGLVGALVTYLSGAIASAKLVNKAHIERNLEILMLIEKDSIGIPIKQKETVEPTVKPEKKARKER